VTAAAANGIMEQPWYINRPSRVNGMAWGDKVSASQGIVTEFCVDTRCYG